jgi:hypothetical protein
MISNRDYKWSRVFLQRSTQVTECSFSNQNTRLQICHHMATPFVLTRRQFGLCRISGPVTFNVPASSAEGLSNPKRAVQFKLFIHTEALLD